MVVGSVNLDLSFYVDDLPRIGETVAASNLLYSLGGKGANQAIAASNLGARVTLVATLGEDSNGDVAREFLLENGLDLEFVETVPDAPTGVASIVIGSRGDNMVTVALGANERMTTQQIETCPMTNGDILVTQLEISREAVQASLVRAADSGATSILNAAPIRSWAERVWARADVVIVNEVELQAIAGVSHIADIETTARSLRGAASQSVVVTLGGAGVFALINNRAVFLAGHKVSVQDATGAGDCFVGAFASRLARGWPLEDSLVYANAAAAVSVQRFGAAVSMPKEEDVDATRIHHR